TENSHMSEVRTSNISPARMIEDLAALPPLTRISYLEEHFKGLQIRIGGEITRLQDIGFPYATVGVKNKADGAQVLANFSKPLAVIAFLPDTPSSPAKIPRYSFLSHCIARAPFLSPSAHVKPTKCFLDLLKAIKAPSPKLTTPMAMALPTRRCTSCP